MNGLLIFFAIPFAVIIISIALQKILKCPVLIAAITFAIFLVTTFIVGNLNILVAGIIYTLISFITAVLTCIICKILNTYKNNACCKNANDCEYTCNSLRNDLLAINNNCANNSCDNWCNNTVNSSNGVSARINVIPNRNSNGETGCVSGCYRRKR